CQALSSEPPSKVVQEPQPGSHGRTGVTQFAEGSDERVQVRSEQTCPEAFGGRAVWEKVLEHVYSPLLAEWMPTKERTRRLCRLAYKRRKAKGTGEPVI